MHTLKRVDQAPPSVSLDHLQAVSRLLEDAKQELTKCRLPRETELEIGSNLMVVAERIVLEINRRVIRNRVLARQQAEEHIRAGSYAGLAPAS